MPGTRRYPRANARDPLPIINGSSLYGLQHSNPVDTQVAYRGPSENIGTVNDPMVGHKIGGVNVFGGGLALYNSNGYVKELLKKQKEK